MKGLLVTIILTSGILSVIGCSEAVRDWVLAGSGEPPNSSNPSTSPLPLVTTWDFTDASNYLYDSKYIEVTNGAAELKLVDQNHSGSDFLTGSHKGTYYDSNSQTIKLVDETHPSLDVAQILPSKASNLIAYWKLNGSLNDSSSYGTTGLSNSPVYSEMSKVGSHAFMSSANGTLNDTMTATSSIIGEPNNLTVSFWLKSTGTSDDWGTIFYKTLGVSGSRGWMIQKNGSNGQICIRTDTVGGFGDFDCGSKPVFDDSYHHIVVILNNGSKLMYIDGALDMNASFTHGTGFGDSAQILNLMGHNTSREISGNIDEIAFWNTDLSLLEIQALYKVQSQNHSELSATWTPKWTQVMGYWNMDRNWNDTSGNGNHGTATNSPTYNSSSKIGNYAGEFDDETAYQFITIPNTATVQDIQEASFTISAWYRPSSLPNNTVNRNTVHAIFAKSGFNLGLGYSASGGLYMTIYDSSDVGFTAYSPVNYPPGIWYYIVGVVDLQSSNLKLYIDGKLSRTTPIPGFISREYGSSSWRIGAGQSSSADTNYGNFADGTIDDVVLWNTYLTSIEVSEIYQRQKQKYSGHFESSIIDLGRSSSWSSLASITKLPFYKEIPASGSLESALDYPALTGNLTDQLIGYWTFNEDTPGLTDFNDKSGSGHHASANNGVAFEKVGILRNAIGLDGVDDYVSIPHTAGLKPPLPITVCSWLSLRNYPSTGYGVFENGNFNTTSATYIGFKLSISPAGNISTSYGDGGSPVSQSRRSKTSVAIISETNKWTYICVTLTGPTDMELYINGINAGGNYSGTGDAMIYSIFETKIGRSNSTSDEFFDGVIDEVAFWSRALTNSDIQQLYRRGANRIKYQVKSCIDASCFCTSYNLGASGSASDCDGDGILNGVDPIDSFKSQWIGRDGATGSFFAELQNCSSIDGITTGECTGTVSPKSPIFNFTDFPSQVQPADNQYFQYKILMEAEENLACASETRACLPDLTLVTIGPMGRYYGNTPVISSATPVAYARISQIVFSESGCLMTYQLSSDGINYRYWNGSLWAVASGPTPGESASASVTSNNIATFSDQAGAGNLHWRAFMNSDTSQACQLRKVSLSVFK